jgi:DNA-binding transcriptional MerR regulator
MDKLYTIQEVATKLSLSDKTLRRWEEAGRFIPSRTLGNQRRYSLEDLQILDAIKHGTINDQSELLSIELAAKLCGVSPTTILRWEDAGKIHPFITSGNTYYPKNRLIEKMEELKRYYNPEPVAPPPRSVPHYTAPIEPTPPPSEPVYQPPAYQPVPPAKKLEPLTTPLVMPNPPFNLRTTLFNILVTLILILSYHLLFNTPKSTPINPQGGSVQGVQTAADPTIDMLHKVLDPSGAITATTLTGRVSLDSPLLSLTPTSAPTAPTPGTIYYDASSQSLKLFKNNAWSELSPLNSFRLDNAVLVSGTATLPKGKNQVSVTHPNITEDTPVTATFNNDYSPAKKYWVTTIDGSFTLHTDFPMAQDSPFNYTLTVPATIN